VKQSRIRCCATASHRFGVYQRARTAGRGFGDNCGKLCAVLHWYQGEYDHAQRNILFGAIEEKPAVFIDNHLLLPDRPEGLFLRLDRLVAANQSGPLKTLSTSKAFLMAPDLANTLSADVWRQGRTPIGDRLTADMFFFRRTPVEGPEGHDLLETSLGPAMPALVTSAHPALDAARYHTQVEFDRTYRSFLGGQDYRGKNLLFVAGLNIDVSPPESMPYSPHKIRSLGCLLSVGRWRLDASRTGRARRSAHETAHRQFGPDVVRCRHSRHGGSRAGQSHFKIELAVWREMRRSIRRA